MSAEALKQEIRKSAEENGEKVLADARVKADKIIAEAEREATSLVQAKVDDNKKRLEQLQKSEAARARMECRKRLLGLESKYVDEAFRESESRIMSLPTSDPKLYEDILRHLTIQALDQLNEETNLIAVVRESDRALGERILNNLSVEQRTQGRDIGCSISPEPLHASGGIEIHTENMRVYCVNTFESRFSNSKDFLRAKVTKALLPQQQNRTESGILQ